MPTPDNLSYDFPDLISDAVDIWDKNAEWWDDKIGDGNDFQELLIEPSTHELLDIQPGERVLEIACGSGRVVRVFDRYPESEAAYFEQTRIFPIMHVLAIRRSAVAAAPDLPAPAAFRLDAEVDLPVDATLVPVAKRKLLGLIGAWGEVTLRGVENLVGTGFQDNLVGDGHANRQTDQHGRSGHQNGRPKGIPPEIKYFCTSHTRKP